MKWIAILLCIIFANFAAAEYNETMKRNLFDRYKKTYGRKYKYRSLERNAFNNYVRNLENVTQLNKKSEDQFKVLGLREYNLNKYADQDPDQLLESYAVTMVPYYKAQDDASYTKNYEQSLKQKAIENMHLYDLDETEDLYEKFKTKFGKAYRTFRNKQISYYRFYHTLVELNNKKFNGEDVTMGPDADVVKTPRDYYFDE